MSKDLWGDEPFRDGQPELSNGQWSQQETYTPVAENTIMAARAIQKQAAEQEFDVDDLIEQVSEEDEDDDFTEVLSDARLRLEQGKLYEMIMNHDLFSGVEADPRAAKSVQKQIRNFARERMEIMLGIRQESVVSNAVVQSPFTSIEVQALRDIAAKLITANGMKEEDYPEETAVSAPSLPPKKKTLNTIGSQKTKPIVKPVAKKTEPIKRQAKPKINLPPEMEPDYEPLSKPIHEMTPQELAERDRQATERQKNRLVITPKSQRQEWPSYEQQVAIAQSQVSRAVGTPTKGNLSALIMANLKGSGKL